MASGKESIFQMQIMGREEIQRVYPGVAGCLFIAAEIACAVVGFAILPRLVQIAAGEEKLQLLRHVVDVAQHGSGVFATANYAQR